MMAGFSIFLIPKFLLQALYASTSISTGMKGATKAMVAMNKVCYPESFCFVLFKDQSDVMPLFLVFW